MHKFFILIHLLHSSICFEHYCAHIQKDNCINTASGIVTLFGWLFSTQCIKIKNLCIKLVKKKDYHYIRMHGQQNVKTFNLVTNVVKTALLRKRMAVNFENHAKPIKCNVCVCVCVWRKSRLKHETGGTHSYHCDGSDLCRCWCTDLRTSQTTWP